VKVYWIDADVLIQAVNLYYPFDRVPKFWSFLGEQLEQQTIKAPKVVYDEVCAGNDELADWCALRKDKGLCIKASKAVQDAYGDVATHVVNKYKFHQANEFLKGGDGWVIAHALDGDGMVVTQESTKSHKAKVKVPTVCKEVGATCINTFQMLTPLKAKF
jgi:hypothetical protein